MVVVLVLVVVLVAPEPAVGPVDPVEAEPVAPVDPEPAVDGVADGPSGVGRADAGVAFSPVESVKDFSASSADWTEPS